VIEAMEVEDESLDPAGEEGGQNAWNANLMKGWLGGGNNLQVACTVRQGSCVTASTELRSYPCKPSCRGVEAGGGLRCPVELPQCVSRRPVILKGSLLPPSLHCQSFSSLSSLFVPVP
jgi:hypothetical protein